MMAGFTVLAQGNHPLTEFRVGCEDSVIAIDVRPGPWNEGRQAGEELQWVEEQTRRSIPPGTLESDSDLSIRPTLQSG